MNDEQHTLSLGDTRIIDTLASTRRRLLDLTRRNRLLNHRSRGRSTLRIVEELPEEIYRLLVGEGRTLQFLAREEAPPAVTDLIPAIHDEEQAYTNGRANESEYTSSGMPLAPIAAPGERAAHHVDHNLQTALAGEKLQTRLLHLAREAGSAQAEQGTNILYLTLGIVEWQEQGQGPICRAPLIFVPVKLQRRDIQSRYSLCLFDDDIVINPSLVELCARTMSFDFPQHDIDDTFDLKDYFSTVDTAVARLPGWRLLSEVHLGLFSFAKLLMYRDLDPATWPAEHNIADHTLVRLLSGIAPDSDAQDREAGLPAPHQLDHIVSPEDTFHVVDADSSQHVAILAAKQGRSMVIEGPPGTGKSQTITNIIAECLAAGKTVLFVAEKAAALSVVQRRLEAVGLGDFVLELHSHRASKRVVLEELNRTLTLAEQRTAAMQIDTREIETTRTQLNQYVQELHAPLGALGISPFTAMVRAIELKHAPEAPCQIANPLDWTPQALATACEQLSTLDRWLERVGDQAVHPWRGTGLTEFGTAARQRLQQRLQGLTAALHALRDAAMAIATRLGVAPPPTAATLAVACGTARNLLAMPRLDPNMLHDSRWDQIDPDLHHWLSLGVERERQKAIWMKYATARADWLDWQAILERRREYRNSLLGSVLPASWQNWTFRRIDSAWKADTEQLEQHLHPDTKLSIEEQVTLLEALVASNQLRAAILAEVPRFAVRFGQLWQHIDDDWHHLGQVAEAANTACLLIRAQLVAPAAAQQILARDDRADLRDTLEGANQALAQAMIAWEQWYTVLSSTEQRWLGDEWQQMPLTALIARVEALPEVLEQIEDWIQLQASMQTCSTGPLAAFTAWALGPEGAVARGALDRSFARQFYRLWIDQALRTCGALQGFRGTDHEHVIQRFCRADLRGIKTNRDRVAQIVRARQPNPMFESSRQSKLGILKGEMRKKRRHMPLRRLIAHTGEAIQSIKPCFMMSPISIAQFLAPGAIEFDLVVFDEASQVEPADAYGAIARGRQVVLVGDEKQLPPTNFFNKIEVDDTASDDEHLNVTDVESILSLGVVRLPHQCTLRWHYRSRHASLIEFSNQRFYDGQLRTFPGPYTSTDEVGLSFRYVANGVYMRGAGQHNPVEARTVAQEVLRHARTDPDRSLGVGAFSVAQQRAIEDEIERLRRDTSDPEVEQFFGKHPEEPFFVKNLETIQGDERDVILLSVGYGRDQNGRLSANFGPLNQEGGWRRLNVLVTRARQRCVLFSSIRADDINLGGTQARGVVALKEYLRLAEQGHLTAAALSSGDHDSPFEAAVCQALRDRGWEVHPQVGTAGFFIDLAVVDPDRPGRYLLGIECDGATYHSSATARDRDRLRQQVLEDLGWTIHRVWSTDWFNRPDTTLQQILARLDEVRQGTVMPDITRHDEPPVDGHDSSVPTRINPLELPAAMPDHEQLHADRSIVTTGNGSPTDNQSVSEQVRPYVQASLRQRKSSQPLAMATPDEIGHLITELVQAESPIHIEEARRAIAGYFATRASKRLQKMFQAGLGRVRREGCVKQRGQFLWTADALTPTVRLRNGDCPVTQAELIAPEEFQMAIKLVLANEFGLQREDLVVSTARLLGYRRCGQSLERAIDAAITTLLHQNQMAYDRQGFVVLAEE